MFEVSREMLYETDSAALLAKRVTTDDQTRRIAERFMINKQIYNDQSFKILGRNCT